MSSPVDKTLRKHYTFVRMLNLLKSPFVGTHELRTQLPKVLSFIKKEQEPVVLTRQGKPAAVVMDVEYFLELQEALKDAQEPGYIQELNKAVEEIKSGKGIPAEKLYKELGLDV